MSEGQLYVWDFTVPKGELTHEMMIEKLDSVSKKWGFQLEKGNTTGFLHYQGRLSLTKKVRLNMLITLLEWKDAHYSASSNNSLATFYDYVMKDSTRVEGPWCNKKRGVPTWLANESPEWYPWQARVIKYINGPVNRRRVNVIVDPEGNNGKTYLAYWHAVRGLATELPCENETKFLMRAIFDMDKTNSYFIDLPRAQNKRAVENLIAAVELLKNGKAYDDRYGYKQEYFNPPHIWIFTNTCFDTSNLSGDRWRFWMINQDLELKRWRPQDE